LGNVSGHNQLFFSPSSPIPAHIPTGIDRFTSSGHPKTCSLTEQDWLQPPTPKRASSNSPSPRAARTGPSSRSPGLAAWLRCPSRPWCSRCYYTTLRLSLCLPLRHRCNCCQCKSPCCHQLPGPRKLGVFGSGGLKKKSFGILIFRSIKRRLLVKYFSKLLCYFAKTNLMSLINS
jgi:hypothetical protein